MPRAKKTVGFGHIAHPDLVYVVNRLIGAGKTTVLEVAKLARERLARISLLQAELATLQGGGRRVPGRAPAASQAAKAPAAPRAASGPKPAKAAPKRRFTVTAKVIAARQVQGQYMGLLRKFAGVERSRIKDTAKNRSVPAAVEMMKKLLAAKSAKPAK